jgi:transcriptional antiterminator NusG
LPIYLFRAKKGQEKSLAKLAALKGSKTDSGVYAILLSEAHKGYAFVEGDSQMKVEISLAGVKPLSARAVGTEAVPIDELSSLLNPRPAIEGLEIGAIVQIIDGPFKGLKAKLTRVEESSPEITVELLDSTMTLPVRIHGDYVKKMSEPIGEKNKGDYGKFSL